VLLNGTMVTVKVAHVRLSRSGCSSAPTRGFQQGVRRVSRQVNLEIVKRSEAGRFVVLPKRWIAERTIAWLNRCRCLAKD